MAYHGLHPGQRHYDPHYRLPDRPLFHTQPIHGVDAHFHRRFGARGLGPQFPRAARRPFAAGSRRGHSDAHGHDGAHAHLPARTPRLGHGPIRHRHRIRARHWPFGGRFRDRRLQLARAVLDRGGAFGGGHYLRLVRAEKHAEERVEESAAR